MQMKNEYRIMMDPEYRIGIHSFEKFSYIQYLIRICSKSEIVVDCTNTTYISPAFATIFGSLPHYGNFYGKKVKIEYNKMFGKRYISDIGIDKYYNNTSGKSISNRAVAFSSVAWDEYEKNMMQGIDSILSQLPIEINEEEKGMLISILGEIFNNAKDHSGFQEDKNIRVYYCGYWNAKNDTYIVSISDSGFGISQNVSKYLNKEMTDANSLEWAFGDGNSTKNTAELDYTRGIGLNSLEKFIRKNNGILYVASGKAICKVGNSSKSIKTIEKPLKGTIYVFTIKVGNGRRRKLHM